jgi:hypothetical protein
MQTFLAAFLITKKIMLSTNFTVNIKMNFVKKLKAFISTLIIKRRPNNTDKKEYQKLSRSIQKAILLDNFAS